MKKLKKNVLKEVDGVMKKKTKKGCKKWLVIHTRHCLKKKKNKKREYGRNQYQNMPKEKKTNKGIG